MIAEARKKAEARIAEAEIMMNDKIKKVAGHPAYGEAITEVRENFVREKTKIEENLEREIEKIRNS